MSNKYFVCRVKNNPFGLVANKAKYKIGGIKKLNKRLVTFLKIAFQEYHIISANPKQHYCVITIFFAPIAPPSAPLSSSIYMPAANTCARFISTLAPKHG